MYVIFNPGGLPYERVGDARLDFELNPLRRPSSAWANLFLSLKDTVLLQCSLGIDVIENFDYTN